MQVTRVKLHGHLKNMWMKLVFLANLLPPTFYALLLNFIFVMAIRLTSASVD